MFKVRVGFVLFINHLIIFYDKLDLVPRFHSCPGGIKLILHYETLKLLIHVFIFERCLNNLDPCGVFQMPCVFVILNYAWVSVSLFQFWFSKSVHK